MSSGTSCTVSFMRKITSRFLICRDFCAQQRNVLVPRFLLRPFSKSVNISSNKRTIIVSIIFSGLYLLLISQ